MLLITNTSKVDESLPEREAALAIQQKRIECAQAAPFIASEAKLPAAQQVREHPLHMKGNTDT